MILKTEKAEYWMHKELDKFILKILSDRTKKLYKKSGLDAEQYPGTYIGEFERRQTVVRANIEVQMKDHKRKWSPQINLSTHCEFYERNDKLLLSTLWVLGFGERSIYTCIWESNPNKKH